MDEEIIDITIDCIDNNHKSKTINIEGGFDYLNPYIITIFAILIGVFVIQMQNGLDGLSVGNINNFTYKFSNYHKGNIYGIFTSMFLHGSIEHIIGNLLFFYIFALISYRVIGFYKSILVYIVTGLGAGVLSYYCNDLPSLGASGALFGIFGFFTPFFFLHKDKLTPNLLDISWTFVVIAIILIGSGFAVPYIDNFAHLGGYFTGIVLGYIYFKSDYFRLEDKKKIYIDL